MKFNRKKFIEKFVMPFKSGFFSTLVFHQGLILLFFYLDYIERQPYNMKPTQPFLIPSVVSLAFFGGLWGIGIWNIVCALTFKLKLFLSILLGALGPTLVAMFIVFPLKGLQINTNLFVIGLVLNAFWGFGLWVLMLFQPKI